MAGMSAANPAPMLIDPSNGFMNHPRSGIVVEYFGGTIMTSMAISGFTKYATVTMMAMAVKTPKSLTIRRAYVVGEVEGRG